MNKTMSIDMSKHIDWGSLVLTGRWFNWYPGGKFSPRFEHVLNYDDWIEHSLEQHVATLNLMHLCWYLDHDEMTAEDVLQLTHDCVAMASFVLGKTDKQMMVFQGQGGIVQVGSVLHGRGATECFNLMMQMPEKEKWMRLSTHTHEETAALMRSRLHLCYDSDPKLPINQAIDNPAEDVTQAAGILQQFTLRK